jgi:hypothetical protein
LAERRHGPHGRYRCRAAVDGCAWARQAIEIGHPGFRLTPIVIELADIPKVRDRDAASQLPQLAVLSALAHPELEIAEVAIGAIAPLPEDPYTEERIAATQQITVAWNPAPAQALAQPFNRTAKPTAADSAAIAIRQLDVYRAEWLADRLDAWAATLRRDDQSTEMHARRLACFDQLAETMAGLVALFITGDPSDIQSEHAVDPLAEVTGAPPLDAAHLGVELAFEPRSWTHSRLGARRAVLPLSWGSSSSGPLRLDQPRE